jgi:hypothetical protein
VPIVPAVDTDLWSITGTFDYLLAEGLTMKTEFQYTSADAKGVATNSDLFPKEGKPGPSVTDGQFIVGLQLVYAF